VSAAPTGGFSQARRRTQVVRRAAARALRGETAAPLDGSARLTFRLLWAAGTLSPRRPLCVRGAA